MRHRNRRSFGGCSRGFLPDGLPLAGEIDFFGIPFPRLSEIEVAGSELARFGLPCRGLTGADEVGEITCGFGFAHALKDAMHGGVATGGTGDLTFMRVEQGEGAIEAQIVWRTEQSGFKRGDSASLGGKGFGQLSLGKGCLNLLFDFRQITLLGQSGFFAVKELFQSARFVVSSGYGRRGGRRGGGAHEGADLTVSLDVRGVIRLQFDQLLIRIAGALKLVALHRGVGHELQYFGKHGGFAGLLEENKEGLQSLGIVAYAGDGTVVVRLSVTDTGALILWVLDLLDHAEVLRPPEVRAEVMERLRASTAGGSEGR